jgi:flavin-dependent dehydrogenase
VLLVGDAAGMVSPLTAGGIHAALKHGLAAGHAVTDFLQGRREDPCRWFVDTYPRFRTKRLLRLLFDHFQSDTAFNLLLGSSPMRMAASIIYFHRKGANSFSRAEAPPATPVADSASADPRPD